MNLETYHNEERAILEERARVLAVPKNEQTQEIDSTVAVVLIGEEQFGIPVDILREILHTPPIAHLPRVPTWMRGVVHLRGDLVTVVDIGPWFEAKIAEDRPFVAVLDGSRGALGVLVDAAVGIREVSKDQIAEKLVSPRNSENLAIATTKDLVTLLDANRLFEHPEIVVDRRLDTISSQRGARMRPATRSERSSKP